MLRWILPSHNPLQCFKVIQLTCYISMDKSLSKRFPIPKSQGVQIILNQQLNNWRYVSILVIASICIAMAVRGFTNSTCIQIHIPSILCPFKRTYVRVSPACFNDSNIRKFRTHQDSICVQFWIPFLYSRPFHLFRFIYITKILIMLPLQYSGSQLLVRA